MCVWFAADREAAIILVMGMCTILMICAPRRLAGDIKDHTLVIASLRVCSGPQQTRLWLWYEMNGRWPIIATITATTVEILRSIQEPHTQWRPEHRRTRVRCGRVQLVSYNVNKLNGHTAVYKYGEIQNPDTPPLRNVRETTMTKTNGRRRKPKREPTTTKLPHEQ